MPSAKTDSTNENVRKKAAEIVIAAGAKTDYERIKAAHKWVAENTDYSIVLNKEKSSVYKWDFSKTLSGDCEDVSNLEIALIKAMGVPAKRAVGSVAYEKGGEWYELGVQEAGSYKVTYLGSTKGSETHSWVMAYDRDSKRWVISDPTWDLEAVVAQHSTKGYSSTANFDPTIEEFSKDHHFLSFELVNPKEASESKPARVGHFLPLEALADCHIPMTDITYNRLSEYFDSAYFKFGGAGSKGADGNPLALLEYPTFAQFSERIKSVKDAPENVYSPPKATQATPGVYVINGEKYMRPSDLAYAASTTDKPFVTAFDEKTKTLLITTGKKQAKPAPAKGGAAVCDYADVYFSIDGAPAWIRAFYIDGELYISVNDVARARS